MKFVCLNHFTDEHIKQYIFRLGAYKRCNYCTETTVCIDLASFANYVGKCLRTEYEDPVVQGLPFFPDSPSYETSFFDAIVQDTREVLHKELAIKDMKCEIIEDLSNGMRTKFWTELGWVSGSAREIHNDWVSFKNLIKYKIRYLFFNRTFPYRFDNIYGENVNPFKILKEVRKAIIEFKLITEFPAFKLKVYRGRQHPKDLIISSAADLGSSPPEKAKANRMSPAGISMFYGAFEKETCIKEIEDIAWADSAITIGEFINLITLKLIDFTKLSGIPSLFDSKNHHKRSAAKFFCSFINDVSEPVRPDDSIHIEYVPTQIVGEYFKYMMPKKRKVDGIIYHSVKYPTGKCVVLFIENDNIEDANRKRSEYDVLLPSFCTRKMLMLLNDSLETGIQPHPALY